MLLSRLALLALLVALTGSALGCAEPAVDDVFAETGQEGPFDSVPEEGKADGVEALGPTILPGATTEVWAVRNQWTDTTTTEARLAGVAWTANSGLDWEQKFERWVASFELIAREDYGQTVRIRTPFGERALAAPTLECAEFGTFMRITFASWYGLPFFLTGWDSTGRQAMYAGHFGFVNRNGVRIQNFPNFRTAYTDYSDRWRVGQAWPSDARLRTMRLGTDDEVRFLSTPTVTAGGGAYFDELFLNKRVGYFARLALLYYGSVNLADGANTYQTQPESLRAGDLLVHRWQRRGIGHVLPILRRTDLSGGRFEAAVASGSMPRRQPLWAGPATARGEFLTEDAGSSLVSAEGVTFAALGGGLRRWRTPMVTRNRWRNAVRPSDVASFIDETNVAVVGARVARFQTLFPEVTPEVRRDAALERIANARTHLTSYPTSCSARTGREDGFAELVTVMAESFDMTEAQVHAQYGRLEDRVFAELTYAEARTCCWNSSTAAMSAIALRYAQDEQARATTMGVCVEPTVFRAEAADLAAGGDGYGRWRTYAGTIGMASAWRAWSEDETCSGRMVQGDRTTARTHAFCRFADGTCDPAPGDDTISTARPLTALTNAKLCGADDVDVYRVVATRNTEVIVRFTHAMGDIDIEAVREDGTRIAQSLGVTGEERIRATGTFYVRVFLNSGTNPYSIETRAL